MKPRRVWWGRFSELAAGLALLPLISPMARAAGNDAWSLLAPHFQPPPEFAGKLGGFRSPLRFDDGAPVASAADWPRRRQEIQRAWHELMGPWPKVIEHPSVEVLSETRRENFRQRRVRLEIAPGQKSEGWLLIPDGSGPFPAVLVVFYEPETSAGLNTNRFRDFGYQLARRGFITLNIGTPGGNAWQPDVGVATCQPLSFHAHVAANAWNILAGLPEVDSSRIGVVGHSYGGKWALFAGALWEKFAAVAVSDPGIVFDETRSNVNYWEPWYLGFDPKEKRAARGLPTAQNPRTGAYRRMVEAGRDLHELHALIAPRPFLVSGGAEDPPSRWLALNHALEVNQLLGLSNRVAMTNRKEHSPDEDSNAKLYAFFEHFLLRADATKPGAPSPIALSGVERLRLIIETDAGGDPDDEQSLVRFLLYANEWDTEGIIANRAAARDGENQNPERSGLGIVRRLLTAYGQCHTNLVRHDPRFPTRAELWRRTVAGYRTNDDAVNLLIEAVDRDDPRPVWYSDWGTDEGAGTNNLKRALDRVRRERGAEGYAKFKSRLRLSSADKFGEHTATLKPSFPLWVDPFRPAMQGRRWYHQFSAITAKAGGFDLMRDCLTGHGPLGALYPTNTTHWQKEGDTMTFLYLVPNGLNEPTEPTWGGWAGRHGLNTNYPGQPFFWASAVDQWHGTAHRDNTLRRWATHLQNDFKARLDWCVAEFAQANHPPVARVAGGWQREARAGKTVTLDASASSDPDKDQLSFEWIVYPEPGGYRGPVVTMNNASSPVASLVAPRVNSPQTLHIVLAVTDAGSPPLTRYQRVVLGLRP
jgi:Protein of unknown function (DUF1593)/REJ domain/Esterase FrsA-like